jgi:hypothetical protein
MFSSVPVEEFCIDFLCLLFKPSKTLSSCETERKEKVDGFNTVDEKEDGVGVMG